MIGMFTARENEERLDRIQEALRQPNLHPDVRGELEVMERELQAWFADLWRVEGGGAE